jgi:tetratricopeptide (TPR) repeat protein
MMLKSNNELGKKLKPNMLAEPVLVGRKRELEELNRYLKLASEGNGTTVFVSAEAGIGKTRLVNEFLGSACQQKDIIVLAGWCLFNAGIPYFPFIEAFTSYYSSLDDKSEKEQFELNSWLKGSPNPILAGKLEYLSPQALKDQTFFSVAKTIRTIASQNLVILFIEDIHWADSASLALLHYLARAIRGSERVLVLATFRSEELTHDLEGYPHQLVETLALMRREDLFDQINLPNLDPVCITKIAESMLGGTLQQALAEKISVKSEGNPLFVVDSLRMLHEQEHLVQENNEWRLTVEEIEIPSRIRNVILQRLACLNSVQRRILDAASVIGDEFEVGLLSTVVDQDSLDVLETLNAIAQFTSIICVDEDRFRFDHTRSREIIYEAIAKPLRQGYHNRVAAKLEALKSTTIPLSCLAYHYAHSGNKEKAVKYALASGQDELTKWSNAQAIKHFKYTLDNLPEGQIEQRITALEGLGDAYVANNMFKEGTRTFEELGDTAETRVAKLRGFRKAIQSAYQMWDPDKMLELVKKAEPYATANRLENARVLNYRSRALLLQSKPYIEDLENALQVFEEEYSLWDVAWALMNVGNFHAEQGKDHEGLAEALRSLALFDEIADFRSKMELLFVAGFDFILCMLYKEALDVYEKMIEMNESMKMGDYLHTCLAYSWSGALFSLHMDDLEKGLSYNLMALELSKKTDSFRAKEIVYSNLTREYALLGDVEHAEEYYKKLLELRSGKLNGPYGEFARAVFLVTKGQWRAIEELRERLKISHIRGWSRAADRYYIWMLERQGRFEEAIAQREENNKKLRKIEKRFEHANVRASLMVRRKVVVGEEFEMRFDIVNVGRKSCKVLKIEGAVPSELAVIGLPSFCSLQNGSLSLEDKVLAPFSVETIKLKLKSIKANNYNILSEAFFIDDLGEIKASKLNSITITAKLASSETKRANIPDRKERKSEFRSEAAEKAFNYLTKAYEEDQLRHRITQEKMGWRTLTEISRNAHISMYSMYGRHAKGGEAVRELRLMDIIELRSFLGERGRGGRVLKMRIRYEKQKQLADE